MSSTPLYSISIVVPAAASAYFSEVMQEFGTSVSAFELAPGGEWRIEALGPEPDRAELATILALAAANTGVPEPVPIIEKLPQRDWVAENQRSFRPIAAGRFLVHPSHDRPHAPGRIAICIDAGEAFGSGEHETTRLCLLALDRLARSFAPRRALDMGCGSGVLAIAMARAWRITVLAVDLAPEAVRVARQNVADNGVATSIACAFGDGYRTPQVRGRYDLVAANILQRPLMRMAPDLVRHLAPGGRAVLSGFQPDQVAPVVAAHRAQGLTVERCLTLSAWSALVLRKAYAD